MMGLSPKSTLNRFLKYGSLACVGSTALLLTPQSAEAVLTVTFSQQGSDVVAVATGTIDLSGLLSFQSTTCSFPSEIIVNQGPGQNASFCIGDTTSTPFPANSYYQFSGPSQFLGSSFVGGQNADLASGSPLGFDGGEEGNTFRFADGFTSGSYSATATWANKTLAQLGFGQTGLLATYTATGTAGLQQIEIYAQDQQAVPGPLPIFGAAGAFAWSRQLRRRIKAHSPLA